MFGLADIAVKEGLTVQQEEVEQAVQKARAEGMQDSEDLRDNVGQALAVSSLSLSQCASCLLEVCCTAVRPARRACRTARTCAIMSARPLQ